MKFGKLLLGALIVTALAAPLYAQSFCPLVEQKFDPKKVASLDEFEKIATLHEGRVKPLDTYARSLMLQFSGHTSYQGEPAVAWLAKLVFAPASTLNDKVFLINNPEIPMALGIDPIKKRKYSFAQINPGTPKLTELAKVADQIGEKNRSIVEREILRVYHNVVLYTQFSYVTTFAFPHPDFAVGDERIIRKLGLPEDQNGKFSFLDIAINADALRKATAGLEINDPQTWSEDDKIYARLLERLFQWAQTSFGLPHHVIPSTDLNNEAWFGMWDGIIFEFFDKRVRNEIDLWRDMAVHYWNGDQLSFDLSARAFTRSVADRLDGTQKRSVDHIPLELRYNKARFFLWAKLLYSAAFLVFLLSFYVKGLQWRKVALGLIGAGWALHAVAIIIRIILMARPPVSNLYETFIFVGLVSVLVGLIIERINKRWLGILVASVSGFVFLLIATKFSAEGDTMQMLVAVLNSNFWLGTHVLTITTGYATTCVAGLIGHLYLIQRIARPKDKPLTDSTYRHLTGMLAFALAMTFFGTMLGGIWADQSWGRFWGWDPKENGALLIVIWTAMIFHARVAKLIGPLGMAAAAALGIIVVMWAWFGVNLLSIGLHSYGFTSGVATGLLIYVLLEVAFVVGGLAYIRRKKL